MSNLVIKYLDTFWYCSILYTVLIRILFTLLYIVYVNIAHIAHDIVQKFVWNYQILFNIVYNFNTILYTVFVNICQYCLQYWSILGTVLYVILLEIFCNIWYKIVHRIVHNITSHCAKLYKIFSNALHVFFICPGGANMSTYLTTVLVHLLLCWTFQPKPRGTMAGTVRLICLRRNWLQTDDSLRRC